MGVFTFSFFLAGSSGFSCFILTNVLLLEQNTDESGCFAVKGEKGNFKGRVFGGFNRHDVIDYIETLADERNRLARENERLRGQLEALEERLAREPEETPAPETEPSQDLEGSRRELREALERARTVLKDVKSEYDAVCADIKIDATQTSHELTRIDTKLTGLMTSLSDAGKRVSDIGAELERDAEE